MPRLEVRDKVKVTGVVVAVAGAAQRDDAQRVVAAS